MVLCNRVLSVGGVPQQFAAATNLANEILPIFLAVRFVVGYGAPFFEGQWLRTSAWAEADLALHKEKKAFFRAAFSSPLQ